MFAKLILLLPFQYNGVKAILFLIVSCIPPIPSKAYFPAIFERSEDNRPVRALIHCRAAGWLLLQEQT